ncbi:MAG: YdeI/OmpD-associated family protein [Oryzihumus sp.]
MAVTGLERDPSDGWLIVPFPAPGAFEAWLDDHHATEPGVWVKFAKKGTGTPSLTLPEAIEVAACFGWVDSKMHGVDETWYVLRFQPRRARSSWSPGNRELAERLIADGRMRPAGLAQVAAARAGGRWEESRTTGA